MTELGDLRAQVDELKQRLSTSDNRQRSDAGQLREQLSAIKATVQSKQDKIDRLHADATRLQAEIDRLQNEVGGKQGEVDGLAADNRQLRTMLEEVLSAVDSHSAKGSAEALNTFCVEMAALVGTGKTPAPGGDSEQDVIVVPARPRQRGDEAPAAPEGAPETGAKPDGPQDPFEEIEESPALRRILRRGRGIK